MSLEGLILTVIGLRGLGCTQNVPEVGVGLGRCLCSYLPTLPCFPESGLFPMPVQPFACLAKLKREQNFGGAFKEGARIDSGQRESHFFRRSLVVAAWFVLVFCLLCLRRICFFHGGSLHP